MPDASSSQTCPVSHTTSPIDDEAKCPVDPAAYKHFLPKDQQQDTETCPVDHTAYKQYVPPKPVVPPTTVSAVEDEATCPVDPAAYQHLLPKDQQLQPAENAPATCPVDHGAATLPVKPKATDKLPPTMTTDGCDSSAIDQSNHMPHISQQPMPDQKQHLGKAREISSIPRANHDEKVWVYPSEQMFFNAMRRKNWDPKESDMPVVVPIHNAVNEMAWKHILEWEAMHNTECKQPKLLKFQGRPKDITPKARVRSWLGYKLPFDRHDWTVDRCGEKVTYVIDFYSGKPDPKNPQAPSFYLDVRPAVSVTGIWDRLRMAWQTGNFA